VFFLTSAAPSHCNDDSPRRTWHGRAMEVVVLWSAGRVAGTQIAERFHVSAEPGRGFAAGSPTPRYWAGDAPGSGRKDHRVPAATVECLVELALSLPSAGRRRWITRLLAQKSALTPGVCPTCRAATGSSRHANCLSAERYDLDDAGRCQVASRAMPRL